MTSSGHSTSDGGGVSARSGRVARTWAAKTVAGSTCSLSSPRRPPPCTAATVTDRTAGPPSGASDPSATASPSPTRMAAPRRATTVPVACRTVAPPVARPLVRPAPVRPCGGQAAHHRGDPHAAGPDARREQKGTPEAGQREQGPVRLPEKDATEGQAAERPRHADGLGQRVGGDEGGRPAPPRRREERRHREEERLQRNEEHGAVPVEGPGPDQPGPVTAHAGEPPRPHAGPGALPGQAPVEHRRAGRSQGPPPPGRQ